MKTDPHSSFFDAILYRRGVPCPLLGRPIRMSLWRIATPLSCLSELPPRRTVPPSCQSASQPVTATRGIEIAAAGKPSTVVGTVVIGAVAIVALYFGRDVFVPMALAILLSFALAPPALLLRRCHFGRVPSVVAVVIVTFVAISGLGVLIGDQFAYLADNLPQYQYNITEKIHSLQGAATNGSLVERLTTMFRDLGKEIAKPSDESANAQIAGVTCRPT